jgi:hypothetical protein
MDTTVQIASNGENKNIAPLASENWREISK